MKRGPSGFFVFSTEAQAKDHGRSVAQALGVKALPRSRRDSLADSPVFYAILELQGRPSDDLATQLRASGVSHAWAAKLGLW